MPSRIFNARVTTPLRQARPSQSLFKAPWICASCQHQRSRVRLSSTNSRKPDYVTTPIFYVNAAPHVGHMYTLILTDILKRWQELLGHKTIMLTGTDEHGMKIQRAAAAAGSDPQSFCDKGAEVFKALAKRCNVSYDTFIRTSDPAHKEGVQHAWHLLKEHGHIYESKHEGWYSVSDETFYPEGQVHLVLDPPTGRKMMASVETGKEVEWTSEVNYHFKLSHFREQLLDFYKANPEWIKPKQRMDYIVQQVEEGLQDLSVSRPTERLQWGVRVPDDPSQTIYVWLDALLNYITAAGYPWTPGQEQALGWPANVQVIGKDIIRFHCIYWPAFLMALNIPLPKNILTHAHWTLGGTGKMSKSSGNVVNPFFALDRFGVDVMRFYLAHDGGIKDDASYDNSFIIEKYKKNLQGGLGNLASRILRGKKWNPKDSVAYGTEHLRSSNKFNSPRHEDFYNEIKATPVKAETDMKNHDVPAALKKIIALVHNTNKYLQACAPWQLAKSDPERRPDESVQDELKTCIFLTVESLRITGILLQPFMPEKANELLNMLGVGLERRSYEWATVGLDDQYGEGNGKNRTLFPPLESEI